MGWLEEMVIKEGERERGRVWEKRGDREEKKLRKKQIHPLYSSPFSMIPLSNHGYKGNKKHGH